ncbi:MAG: ABC transporter ATP-binding protein [Ruminiclostridium sp.]|nr:ABC transporter ATP-binding protein [Ruminiclostridium sp.]
MLEIRDLHKSYKNFKVLDGLYMKIKKGDIYGFLGRNGCGKTTTMNIVCNIIPKDSGEIILGENGNDKIKIGYLPETPSLYGYMNGYEYLGYIAYCSKYKGDVDKRIAAVLAITGMTEGGRRRIKGYSRGMNQRLGIAAAIFNSPDLLILDEPTSALDPEGRAEVMGIIQNLSAAGTTILLCTHILSDVERVSNRIGIVGGAGKLAVEGSIDSILGEYGSESVDIQLVEPDERVVRLIEAAPFAEKTDYYDKTGLAVLTVKDAKAGIAEAMRYLADNSIDVSSVKLSRPTLEQVYMSIVGAQWN